MNTFRLWRLFHRPGHTRQRTSLLAIIAFAAATAIFLTVLGGVHAFIWRASPDHTLSCLLGNACAPASHTLQGEEGGFVGMYVILSVFACVLLIVPFTALAGSAARLAASRRDARLAALRLAGATNMQVVKLTAIDAAGQALGGALIGSVGYLALMPLIMLLNFQNRHFTFEQLWVGPLMVLATCAGVTILALVSSLLTLRRVAITPLGVTQRASSPLPSGWRAIIFVVVLVAAIVVFRFHLFSGLSEIMVYVVVFGFIAGCFALINLVGAWAIAMRAKARLRRPRSASTMIAMRRILDNPKRAWRNVSGIALAVFIAGITSVTSYFGSAAEQGMDASSLETIAMRDIGTGGLLTLALAAVLAAVSCGVMQAGNVYDQTNEYRMLALEGTDMTTMNKARFIEVITPLNVVVVISGSCSMLLMLPIFASAMTSPTTLLFFLAGIALCYALISIGAYASNRVAVNLNLTNYRADD